LITNFEVSAIVRGSNNQGFCVDTNRKLKEKYKRHTKIYTDRDGFKKVEKVRYAVVCEEQTIKRKIHPQNLICSAEQSAIINTIYST
jgi:hypothetical protein